MGRLSISLNEGFADAFDVRANMADRLISITIRNSFSAGQSSRHITANVDSAIALSPVSGIASTDPCQRLYPI